MPRFNRCLLVMAAVFPSLLHATEEDIQFDTSTLQSRGIDPRLAAEFRHAPRFLAGDSRVSLTVNGSERGKISARFTQEGALCPTPEFIRAAGLLLPPDQVGSTTCIDLKRAWPQTEIHLDPSEGRVDVVVPQQALAPQAADKGAWQHGGQAGMLNYSAQYSGSSGDGSSMHFEQLDTEAGFNAEDWIVRSRQTLTRFNTDNTLDLQSAYAQRTFVEQKRVLQAGKISITNSMFGIGSVLGLQLFPEEALQSNRGGAHVSGIADTQSVVEVRQSGVLVYSTTVPAGPFHLEGIKLLNSRMDLDVKLTGTNGVVRSFVVPASSLQLGYDALPLGLSMGVGQLDQDGTDSSPLLGTASRGWQLAPGVSLNAGTLLSKPYRAVATSLDTKPWPNTTLSVQGTAASDEQHHHDGLSGTVSGGYQFSDSIGLSASLMMQGRGYRELYDAIQDDDTNADSLTRSNESVGISWSTPALGSLSLSASHNQPFSGEAYTYLTGTWSDKFDWGYLAVSLQHNIRTGGNDSYAGYGDVDDTENRLYVTLNIPFGERSIDSYINSADDGTRAGVRYSDRSGQDSSWTLSAERNFKDNSHSVTGTANWVTPVSQLSGSLGQDRDTTSWSAQASGALVVHSHGVTLSPYQVGDTFGIARVGDEAGVKLSTPSGPTWTDGQGYAVLPSLDSFRKSTVQVDTSTLPKNVDIGNAWQETELARGAVTYVNFDVARTRRVLAAVKDRNGHPLPQGATVFDAADHLITMVDNGRVFIPNAQPGMKLDVQQAGKDLCHMTLTLPQKADSDRLFETAQATCQ